MNNSVAAVVFDLDGTLLDHVTASNAAVLSTLRSVWMPDAIADDSQVLSTWSLLEKQHMTEYLEGSIDFAEQRRRRLRGLLTSLGDERQLSDAFLDAEFIAYLQQYETHWRPYDDVEVAFAMIERQGVPVAILSNGDRDQQERKVAALNLPQPPRLLVPADTGAAKPARQAFHGACAALGSEPSRTLFVGDDVRADAEGAAAAGLISVWLNRQPMPPSSAKPSLEFQIIEITDLRELGPALQSM